MATQMNPTKLSRQYLHANALQNALNLNLGAECILPWYKSLERLESRAHKLAEACCDWLDMSSPEFDRAKTRIQKSLTKLLGEQNAELVHLNLDPRGYALKLNPEKLPKELAERLDVSKVCKDLGGYYILAPEIN